MTKRSSQPRRTAVVIFVIGLAAVTVWSGLLVTPTSATVDTADRTIETDSVDPGESVMVTVEMTVTSDGERFSLEEAFSPAVEQADPVEITYNGESALPVAFVGDEETVVAALEEDFQDGDTITITYELTVPGDSDPGEEFSIEGEAGVDDQVDVAVTGDDRLTIDGDDIDDPVGVETADRTVTTDVVNPNDIIEIVVEIAIDGAGDRFSLTEEFTPEFADTDPVSIEYNGESVTDPVTFVGDGDAVVVALEEAFEAGDTITAIYEVKIPDDVDPGEEFAIDGEAGIDDQDDVQVTGDELLTVEETDEFGEFHVDVTDFDYVVTQGETLQVDVEVTNEGNATETQDLDMWFDGVAVDSVDITLDPGESAEHTLLYETSEDDVGTDIPVIVASDDDDETLTVTVEEADVDPAFITVDIDEEESVTTVTEGDELLVVVDLENTGDELAEGTIELQLDEIDETIDRDVTLDASEETTVVLSYETALGDDTEELSVSVSATPGETDSTQGSINESPEVTANVTADPLTIDPLEDVTFNASASTGQNLTYEWDFDDGAQNVSTVDPVIEQPFDEVGQYTVTLTVTDEFNRTASTTVEISVTEPTDDEIPGFGIVVTLIALVAVLLIARQTTQ